MSPVFGHGHLRLYLLSLLAEAPRHGYELIQALGERFGGTYVPSAGTIYPRLAKLEEDGLVTKQADGRKTIYAITDAGRAELAARQGDLDGIETDMKDSVRRLADEVRSSVNDAMKSLRADLASAANDLKAEARAATAAAAAAAPPSAAQPTSPSATPNAAPDTHNPTHNPAHVRVASRGYLQQADLALAEFRNDLRSDLRRAVVDGTLGEHTLAALTTGLAEVRAAVLDSLDANLTSREGTDSSV
jgi:DNA-binding PadR family transcriptional regulator